MNVKKHSDLNQLSIPARIIFACMGVLLISIVVFVNICLCYCIFKDFPNAISKLIHTYHTHQNLFDSIPYRLHVYFSFLLFVGSPLVLLSSLILSLIYLIRRESKKFIYTLMTPMIFVTADCALGKVWLHFV
jgi:hypothetical protein